MGLAFNKNEDVLKQSLSEMRQRLEEAFRAALADSDFVREADRLGLPLSPRIGADYRADVAALETELRGLWQRRPWKES